jgi:hypothetical protein
MVIWYILSAFDILDQEKSGNPGTVLGDFCSKRQRPILNSMSLPLGGNLTIRCELCSQEGMFTTLYCFEDRRGKYVEGYCETAGLTFNK